VETGEEEGGGWQAHQEILEKDEIKKPKEAKDHSGRGGNESRAPVRTSNKERKNGNDWGKQTGVEAEDWNILRREHNRKK